MTNSKKAVMNKKNVGTKITAKPAIFSFFAGAGFLDLGFEMNGFETVFVNEYHQPFLDAYIYSRKELNIPEPVFGYDNQDIKTFISDEAKSNRLKEIITETKKNGQLVGFIGGPPCPDFSVGGKNRGRNGTNGILSSVYVDLIIKQEPDFFLFENVKGLWSTKRHREYYDELKQKLRNSGYILHDSLINAIEFGAPQDRNRVILLGFKENTLKNLDEAFPWSYAKKYNVEILKSDWPTITEGKPKNSLKKPVGIIDELTISYWFEKNSVNEHPNANDFFTPRAGLEKFKILPEGDVNKKSYKRLHRWRYSPTAAYGNNEVHIHPFLPRRLSVAEALAIQSLPGDYVLPREMTLSNKFKAIGNGVPFLAAEGMAKSIKHFLAM